MFGVPARCVPQAKTVVSAHENAAAPLRSVNLDAMKTALFFAALFALAAATPICGHSQSQPMPIGQMGGMHKPAPAAGPLQVTFREKSATWTAATLASLPHKTVTLHNEHTKADETYSGVQLIDLLTPLGVSDKPRGKDFRLYVVAAGSDGYEVVYSIGEVTPDVGTATVIVADSENGAAIAADGPLKLVATGEKRPARWVRNLVAIRVMTAE
jgi:hypothetical protein